MNSDVEEVKSRINIADLIGEYIRLTRAGSNHRALCPFHNEKSPSFMVSEEKGIWHCFGCGKGGDALSFVMEMEGIGFREALEQLAQKAGVKLTKFEKGERGVEKENIKPKLYGILELATKWYEKNLWEGKGKEKVLKYLHDRGIQDESIKKFRLGYAPDGWRNLLEFLLKKGFTIEEINKTGLLVEKEISNIQYPISNNNLKSQISKLKSNSYDRFRDRIMFPIFDVVGRIVGYSARVAPGGDEKNAKYINTPQTEIYDKGKVLYGLNFAKAEIKKADESILVEGNLDVVASHQAGFPNVIAVSGTALTQDQVKIIKRYSENVKMSFDMDAAGQAAARRSIKTCLENDLNVKIILLLSGKDAAEAIKQDKAIWKKAIEEAKNVVDYFFQEAFSRHNAKDPAGKKKIASELLNVVKDIASPVEQSHWINELAQKLGTSEEVLFDVLKKAKEKEKRQSTIEKKPTVTPDDKDEALEKRIVGILVNFPKTCQRKLGKVNLEDFHGAKERKIVEIVKRLGEDYDREKINSAISDYELRKYSDEAAFEAEVQFGEDSSIKNSSPTDPGNELKLYLERLQQKNIKRRITEISEDIRLAEKSGDKAAVRILIDEFQKLVSYIND
ncbi:MAG: DNA primase [Parcubacteria group bacterium]|jgi:DNA primase